MSAPSLTVAICTHNPRQEFFSRTLDGLRAQTLSADSWDLIVVDNASNPPIQPDAIAWTSRLNLIREMRLGLTAARLAAIAASKSDILVFVDDDNILHADYLMHCRTIAKEFPSLGAWGGQYLPDFIDGTPEEWTRPYWPIIAVNALDADHWTSHPESHTEAIPSGAGLVVRKAVAEAYLRATINSSTRLALDRRGSDLASCGDTDLALTATDIGYGVGRFARLKLTHIIPGGRLTEDYLARLIESMSCSAKLLQSFRRPTVPENIRLRRRIRRAVRLLLGRTTRREVRLTVARERGRTRADSIIESLKSVSPPVERAVSSIGLPAAAD